jgi:quinol monooxygenase YgiN
MMPTLYIRPERRDEFIGWITAEIEHSLRVEPGILRFDLAADQSDPNAIHVYAVYEDEAAYAFHQAQPHYQELMERILPCFAKPPLIRVATNVLPRDPDWARLAAARKRKPAARKQAARPHRAALGKAARTKAARRKVTRGTGARTRRPARKK